MVYTVLRKGKMVRKMAKKKICPGPLSPAEIPSLIFLFATHFKTILQPQNKCLEKPEERVFQEEGETLSAAGRRPRPGAAAAAGLGEGVGGALQDRPLRTSHRGH